MKITISEITAEDLALFDSPEILDGRKRMDAVDADGHKAYTYILEETIQRLGLEYIEKHCYLQYSEVFEEYSLFVSEADYYNDPERNPPKTVSVEFVEMKDGEYTEVWRNVDTGSYYLRQLCNEPFARWLTAGNRMTGFTDRSCFRPNITIRNIANGQTERVYYHDWNETAAYKDTFNAKFRTEK